MPSVLALPDFDLPTRSASGFFLRWIAPRLGPVHLLSFLDSPFLFRISAPPSDIIIGMGHGDIDTLTGQNEVVILEIGKYNPNEVEGKVIKLLACQCGVALGPDVVENGATSFAGYTDDYIWVMDADLAFTPWADEMAARVLMPVIDSINALLDGKTAGEAFDIEIEGYSINAEIEEDELIKACLEFNRDNAILLGDESAKVKARPRIILPIPPPPIFVPIL